MRTEAPTPLKFGTRHLELLEVEDQAQLEVEV
jgi:hypothetical protein